ncbi:hypothetical protein [Oceanicoccus sp. KOV_DT_Chl]|uniref:hypothetical protein n=1 Tax=Oceanicoccus sp. KOV_DT_Chl TaxID=1904639 RepID=UPI00135ABD81|nr:hypothetical protein [Oceanicoccus sp. KOV_DT_Chl]
MNLTLCTMFSCSLAGYIFLVDNSLYTIEKENDLFSMSLEELSSYSVAKTNE